jgi:aminopeptidase N
LTGGNSSDNLIRRNGREREEMEAALGLQNLKEEMEDLPDADEILHVDLAGRDSDEGFTQVPYEKGALFLRHLEEAFGRERTASAIRCVRESRTTGQ